MIQIKPFIYLTRLVITSQSGGIAYDENFHLGVNIIRGDNGSGKSTIANFIYYALGGDFNKWTDAASSCHEVFAEVNINGATVTLKRLVSDKLQQLMGIFWGKFDEIKSGKFNWQYFPYRASEQKVSFSKVLFSSFSYPDIKTENDQSITMHQLLRLLYIDQDTPVQSLFKTEKFDPPLIREAVGEFFLGTYSDSLYNNRLELRRLQRELEFKKSQIGTIQHLFNLAGNELNVTNIYSEINKNDADLTAINQEIITVKSVTTASLQIKPKLDIVEIQNNLTSEKHSINRVQSQLNALELDIVDSKQFIEALKSRVEELKNSMVTKKVFGDIPLKHCPHCLNQLIETPTEGNCLLCKQPLDPDIEKTHAKRLEQEMSLQIKESEFLLREKEKEVNLIKSSLPAYIERAKFLQRELDNAILIAQSTRDETLDKLLIRKGYLEQKNETLTKQIKSVEQIEFLRKEIVTLTAQIEETSQNIQEEEYSYIRNYEIGIQKIKSNSLKLLKSDLPFQSEFQTGKSIDFDFKRDTFSLDGTTSFSASSKVILKNSLLFGIFFSSLDLSFFRYPRFILCDNMEDKGMQEKRSKNFQEVIVKFSEEYDVQHQIIFTTSMVSEKLNNSKYCIGDYYLQTNKSLKVR